MSRQFRVAVLECDTPVDSVKDTLGTYSDIFHRLLQAGLENFSEDAKGVTLELSKWDVVNAQNYPSLEDIDALLLTGSKHTAFANDPWILKLVDYVLNTFQNSSKFIIGICFGHQVIARALEVEVTTNMKGWEVAVDKIALSAVGSSLFGQESLALHQMHRDIALEVPKGFQNLGSSDVCGVQGFFLPHRVMTLQAHPEFTQFIMESILEVRRQQGIFNEEVYRDGKARAALPHDGVLVATAIWRLLLGS